MIIYIILLVLFIHVSISRGFARAFHQPWAMLKGTSCDYILWRYSRSRFSSGCETSWGGTVCHSYTCLLQEGIARWQREMHRHNCGRSYWRGIAVASDCRDMSFHVISLTQRQWNLPMQNWGVKTGHPKIDGNGSSIAYFTLLYWRWYYIYCILLIHLFPSIWVSYTVIIVYRDTWLSLTTVFDSCAKVLWSTWYQVGTWRFPGHDRASKGFLFSRCGRTLQSDRGWSAICIKDA